MLCRLAASIGESLGKRFLLLNYDKVCLDSIAGLRAFIEFLGSDCPASSLESLARNIRRPDSIGRFKQHSREDFDPDDISFGRNSDRKQVINSTR
jgi:hypothetical protein